MQLLQLQPTAWSFCDVPISRSKFLVWMVQNCVERINESFLVEERRFMAFWTGINADLSMITMGIQPLSVGIWAATIWCKYDSPIQKRFRGTAPPQWFQWKCCWDLRPSTMNHGAFLEVQPMFRQTKWSVKIINSSGFIDPMSVSVLKPSTLLGLGVLKPLSWLHGQSHK